MERGDELGRGEGATEDPKEVLAAPLESIASILDANPDANHIALDLTWPAGSTLDFAETCRRAASAIRGMDKPPLKEAAFKKVPGCQCTPNPWADYSMAIIGTPCSRCRQPIQWVPVQL
jgi:hypothetical protein